MGQLDQENSMKKINSCITVQRINATPGFWIFWHGIGAWLVMRPSPSHDYGKTLLAKFSRIGPMCIMFVKKNTMWHYLQ